jgi:hypothetical protein
MGIILSTETGDTNSIDEASSQSDTETEKIVPTETKLEGKQITEHICEECGKSFKNVQGLQGHIRHVHQAKEAMESGQIGINDEERLRRILNEAGVRASSGRDLITSIYFSGEDSPERLNRILKSKAVPLGTRKLVLMAFFNRELEELGIEEFLIGEDNKKTNEPPISTAKRMYEEAYYAKLLAKLSGEDNVKDKEIEKKLELEREKLELEKEKVRQLELQNLRTEMTNQLKEISELVSSAIQSNIKQTQDVLSKFIENQKHLAEVEALKSQINAGERPLVSIGKELSRTIRELPSNIADAVKRVYVPTQVQGAKPLTPEEQLKIAQEIKNAAFTEQPIEGQSIQQPQPAPQQSQPIIVLPQLPQLPQLPIFQQQQQQQPQYSEAQLKWLQSWSQSGLDKETYARYYGEFPKQ